MQEPNIITFDLEEILMEHGESINSSGFQLMSMYGNHFAEQMRGMPLVSLVTVYELETFADEFFDLFIANAPPCEFLNLDDASGAVRRQWQLNSTSMPAILYWR